MDSCTIIVPVYNCEEHLLRRCLDSIRKINKEFEVVAVDDGSTNESGDVLDEYAKKDNRFKVIHITNGGVSAARNTGLENASKNYICFCDADDVIDPDIFDSLYNEIGTDIQFAYSNFKKNINNQDEIISLENILDRNTLLTKILSEPNRYGAVWGNIYNRKTIIENEVFFDEDLSHAEDTEYLVRYLKHIDKITHIKESFYTYYIYDNSAAKVNEKALDNFCLSLERIKNSIQEYPELEKSFGNCCNVNLLIMMVNYIFKPGISYSDGSKVMKDILSRDVFRKSLKCYDEQNMGTANNLVIKMLKSGKIYPAYMAVKVKQLTK